MTHTHAHASARSLFLAIWGLVMVLAGPVAAEEVSADTRPLPARGRVAALITALLHHHAAAPSDQDGGRRFDKTSFASVPPDAALQSEERGKINDFAKALLHDGGYFPQEIYTLLGYRDAEAARVSRTVRRLDTAGAAAPTPWELTGRVGRSGLSGLSDHWAMAPGNGEAEGVSSPGTLAYLPALAVVYAGYQEDGLAAAAQLAILKDDDLRAEPVARVALSLLMGGLTAAGRDKDALLRRAAADSRDLDTEHDVLSVRVKDWRYLRGEECALGRLERAVFLWYEGGTYERIMAKGRELLRSREALAYLAALSAATYGQEALPRGVIAAASSDRQLLELIHGLHDLAISGAVLRVLPEDE